MEEFYTVKELAKLLKVNEMTIYRMMRRGQIPYYNIGRAKRFRHKDVESFLAKVRVISSSNED